MQGTQSDEVQLPDTRTIALMLARCACNNHTICDDELRPIGSLKHALKMRLLYPGTVQ